jgi:RNA recognition motif-containing protein
MKIIVLNIPRNIKPEEIAALFVPFGKVESCNLVMDEARGMHKGFGFVEMPDEAEASTAIAALHGKQVGNQKIRVKISE